MKLEDLNVTKIQYVILDSDTGDLFQDGRMFDRSGDAKNAYYQDTWFSRTYKLARRFDEQDRMKVVAIEYKRVVEEIK